MVEMEAAEEEEVNNNDVGEIRFKSKVNIKRRRRDASSAAGRKSILEQALLTSVITPIAAFLVYQFLLFAQSPSHVLPTLAKRLAEHDCDRGVSKNNGSLQLNTSGNFHSNQLRDTINIAFVSCGSKSRFEEVSVLVKSILVFSSAVDVNMIFFTDSLSVEMTRLVDEWNSQRSENSTPKITLDVREPAYPEDEDMTSIQAAFAPCASLRLFFPQILSEYNKILYVDTDTIFLDSPEKIWQHFEHFDDAQMAGLINENLDEQFNAYNYSEVPSPRFGLNSGVMLMDLQKMRRRSWNAKMATVYSVMKGYLAFVDQDLLNILFHHFPEELYVLPCSTNFRPDFCLSMSKSCPYVDASDSNRIILLHGSRKACQDDWQFGGSFFQDYLPKVIGFFAKNIGYSLYAYNILDVIQSEQRTFKAVYRAFYEFEIRGGKSSNQVEMAKALTKSFLSEMARTDVSDGLRSIGAKTDLCRRLVPNIVESFLSIPKREA